MKSYAKSLGSAAPDLNSCKYTADVLADIQTVKAKLLVEGVEEHDYDRFRIGVVATNLKLPLPNAHCSEYGPALPKGQICKHVFDQKSQELIKSCTDTNQMCIDIAMRLKSDQTKLEMDPRVTSFVIEQHTKGLKQNLYHANMTMATETARKTKFYLDYTPVDAEAFYAKITPLFNELDALAERLRDIRRNLV
jgi:hypothetical protein